MSVIFPSLAAKVGIHNVNFSFPLDLPPSDDFEPHPPSITANIDAAKILATTFFLFIRIPPFAYVLWYILLVYATYSNII